MNKIGTEIPIGLRIRLLKMITVTVLQIKDKKAQKLLLSQEQMLRISEVLGT